MIWTKFQVKAQNTLSTFNNKDVIFVKEKSLLRGPTLPSKCSQLINMYRLSIKESLGQGIKIR